MAHTNFPMPRLPGLTAVVQSELVFGGGTIQDDFSGPNPQKRGTDG